MKQASSVYEDGGSADRQDFLLPLVYLQGSENQMFASGLYLFACGRTGEHELAAPGSLMMTVPVVVFFLIFQRHFIRGLTAGAFT
jgi:ABC-type glycerol-3-phosphate transport system permease component